MFELIAKVIELITSIFKSSEAKKQQEQQDALIAEAKKSAINDTTVEINKVNDEKKHSLETVLEQLKATQNDINIQQSKKPLDTQLDDQLGQNK